MEVLPPDGTISVTAWIQAEGTKKLPIWEVRNNAQWVQTTLLNKWDDQELSEHLLSKRLGDGSGQCDDFSTLLPHFPRGFSPRILHGPGIGTSCPNTYSTGSTSQRTQVCLRESMWLFRTFSNCVILTKGSRIPLKEGNVSVWRHILLN